MYFVLWISKQMPVLTTILETRNETRNKSPWQSHGSLLVYIIQWDKWNSYGVKWIFSAAFPLEIQLDK